jgi:hypothetical protein
VKLTLSAAMRARDVSRPRPEDLADADAMDAEAAEAKAEEARIAVATAAPAGRVTTDEPKRPWVRRG